MLDPDPYIRYTYGSETLEKKEEKSKKRKERREDKNVRIREE